jgi:AsmA protein
MGKAVQSALLILLVLAVAGMGAAWMLCLAFLDPEEYRAELERAISRAVGRPVTLAGHIRLSMRPWAGLEATDIRISNPPGWQEPHFIALERLELRGSLLRLLLGELRVERLDVQAPRVVLERSAQGLWNWERTDGGSSPSAEQIHPRTGAQERSRRRARIGFDTLAVRELRVSRGSLALLNGTRGGAREVTDVEIRLEEAALARPFTLSLEARLDGRPVSVRGRVGPVGSRGSTVEVPVEVTLGVLDALTAQLRGTVSGPSSQPKLDLVFRSGAFSLPELLSALGMELPWQPAHPEALSKVALEARIEGTPSALILSRGRLDLDGRAVGLSLRVGLSPPSPLSVDATADALDLDPYLPAPAPTADRAGPGRRGAEEKGPKGERVPLGPPPPGGDAPAMEAAISAGKIRLRGVWLEGLRARMAVSAHLIRFPSLEFGAYEGKVQASGTLALGPDGVAQEWNVEARGLQANPLLREMFRKGFLQGRLDADMQVRFMGADPRAMGRSLWGQARLSMGEGAIVGVDLTRVVRSLGLTERRSDPQWGQGRATAFSGLRASLIADRGLVTLQEAAMTSPGLEITATGTAHLVKETLDLRLEPALGGGEPHNASLVVPVLVRGTFDSPRFVPDLAGIRKKGDGRLHLKLPSSRELKDLLRDMTRGR